MTAAATLRSIMLWPASNCHAPENQPEIVAVGYCRADNGLGGCHQPRTRRDSCPGIYNAVGRFGLNHVETGFFEPAFGLVRRHVFSGAFGLPAGLY